MWWKGALPLNLKEINGTETTWTECHNEEKAIALYLNHSTQNIAIAGKWEGGKIKWEEKIIP